MGGLFETENQFHKNRSKKRNAENLSDKILRRSGNKQKNVSYHKKDCPSDRGRVVAKVPPFPPGIIPFLGRELSVDYCGDNGAECEGEQEKAKENRRPRITIQKCNNKSAEDAGLMVNFILSFQELTPYEKKKGKRRREMPRRLFSR